MGVSFGARVMVMAALCLAPQVLTGTILLNQYFSGAALNPTVWQSGPCTISNGVDGLTLIPCDCDWCLSSATTENAWPISSTNGITFEAGVGGIAVTQLSTNYGDTFWFGIQACKDSSSVAHFDTSMASLLLISWVNNTNPAIMRIELWGKPDGQPNSNGALLFQRQVTLDRLPFTLRFSLNATGYFVDFMGARENIPPPYQVGTYFGAHGLNFSLWGGGAYFRLLCSNAADGRGNATFTRAFVASGDGAAEGDFDGNGQQDWALTNGNQTLVFSGGSSGYGLQFYHTGRLLWQQTNAVAAETTSTSHTRSLEASPYQSVSPLGAGFLASGILTAPGGTKLTISDLFFPNTASGQDPGLRMVRETVVSNAAAADIGFQSVIQLNRTNQGGPSRVLMPGALYADRNYTSSGTLGNNSGTNVIREDRLSAPVISLLDTNSGYGFGFFRYLDEPNTTIDADSIATFLIDSRLTFGSMGFNSNPTNTAFLRWVYPGSEYDWTYLAAGGASALRYHPVTNGFSHHFGIVLTSGNYGGWQGMLESVWTNAVNYYAPQPRTDINLKEALTATVNALTVQWQDNLQSQVGIPDGANVFNGIQYDYTFSQGFVGPTPRMAVAMLYQGFQTGDEDMLYKARRILSGWAAWSGSGLAHDKWNTQNNGWVDDGAQNVVWLRMECEGHLNALEGYWIAEKYGNETHADWRQWALSFADWLVTNQKTDGSYYREYSLTSAPPDMSKTCSSVPIGFLCAAYKETGDSRYLAAAISAANFSWTNYNQYGSFAGATPDNPDVKTKESAIFATEGYVALYEATGDNQWLNRAEMAALTLESWHYIVLVPGSLDHPLDYTRWVLGNNNAGLGLIAVGHSGCDTYASGWAVTLYKLFQYTGKAHYSRMSQLIIRNCMQPLDLSGAKGYYQPGFMTELWVFSVSQGNPRGWAIGPTNWEPWSTANAAYGLVRLLDAFGDFFPVSRQNVLAGPTNLSAGALSPSQIALSWTYPATNETGFVLQHRAGSQGGFAPLVTLPASLTNYTDSGLAAGTRYDYELVVFNTVGSSAPSPQASAVTLWADPNLVAWYRFDENSGTVAHDSSGNGRDASLIGGAGFVSGVTGNAVNLNGTNAYVQLPAGIAGSLGDFTIAAWADFRTMTNWARIFDFGNGTTTYLFLTPQSSDGYLRFAITTNGNGAEQRINAVIPPITGTGWNHFAVTRAGSVGTLYLNGTAVGGNNAITITPSSLGSTANNFIGKSQFAADPYLNGLVDDFRIYQRALSAAEVQALMTDNPQPKIITPGAKLPFGFRILGVPYMNVAIQTSTNLFDWSWQTTNTLTGYYWDFTDSTTGFPQKFYRVFAQ